MSNNTGDNSATSAVVHIAAAMLRKAGALDKITMRDVGVRHLAAPDLIGPTQIKQPREAHNGSQRPVARTPDISKGTIEK